MRVCSRPIEPVSEFKHLFTLLTNRFLKFYFTLFLSNKNIIRNLRRIQEKDCRSDFGSNIRNICRFNGTTNIFACLKDNIKYFTINESDFWRVDLLKELISIKRSPNNLVGFSRAEIDFFIDDLAGSDLTGS